MTHNPFPMGENLGPNTNPTDDHSAALDALAGQLGEGGFDMAGLLAQAQAMQSQFESAQAEIAASVVHGSAGGDLVTVTMTGAGEVSEVVIKPEACDPEDTETLGDLVVAALRDAHTQAQTLAQSKMGPLAGGFGR